MDENHILIIHMEGRKKKSQPSCSVVKKMTKLKWLQLWCKFIECAHYTMHTHIKAQICKFTKTNSNVEFKILPCKIEKQPLI